MSTPVTLATPPMVAQGNRHICWASAYESWILANRCTTPIRTAQQMIDILRRAGTGSPDGLIVDANDRLLPDGIAVFAQMAQMRFEMTRPKNLTVDLIRRRLGTGHIWFWGTPAGAAVAHIVVVYGIDANNHLLVMDPLHGFTRPSLQHLRGTFQIFGIGTPLLAGGRSPAMAVFQNMLTSATAAPPNFAAPRSNPLYPGR